MRVKWESDNIIGPGITVCSTFAQIRSGQLFSLNYAELGLCGDWELLIFHVIHSAQGSNR